MIIFLTILSAIIIISYLISFKNNRMSTKEMIMASLIAAISLVLSLIHIVRYPQGGGISLFSMMPVMLFSLLYGKTAGVTAGLVFGLLSLLDGPYVIHPVQFLLDYIFPTMALGLASIFGNDKKIKIVAGSLVAVLLNVLSKVLSGVIFFGEFAPEGMGPIIYSLIYNFSTAGVEGALCIVILCILPLNRLKRYVGVRA